jgi:uncharacterized membrane protein
VWSGGVLKTLGKPANHAYSFGYGINDKGAVVGSAKALQREDEPAARFQPGVGWQVLSGLGWRNVLRAVNNSGVAVGAAGDYSNFALASRTTKASAPS